MEFQKIQISELGNQATQKSSHYVELLSNWAIEFIPKIIGALIVIWVGFKVVNFVNSLAKKSMDKFNVEPMLESFIMSLIAIILKLLVLVSAVGIVGVETSSFVAIFAAAWLAIGLALSGTLQNFAGWVMILIFKPFKIWDFIEAGGHAWVVKEIHIFNTMLLSGDRKLIIVPNAKVSNDSMINFSSEKKRRIDLVVGISYDDDIDTAKSVLEKLSQSDERIIVKDGVTIAVGELWASSVDFNFRFFVKSADYWDVRSDMLETVKKTFDKKGLHFPYPQSDVHTYAEKK